MLYSDYNSSIRDIFKQVEEYPKMDWKPFLMMGSAGTKVLCRSRN